MEREWSVRDMSILEEPFLSKAQGKGVGRMFWASYRELTAEEVGDGCEKAGKGQMWKTVVTG